MYVIDIYFTMPFPIMKLRNIIDEYECDEMMVTYLQHFWDLYNYNLSKLIFMN